MSLKGDNPWAIKKSSFNQVVIQFQIPSEFLSVKHWSKPIISDHYVKLIILMPVAMLLNFGLVFRSVAYVRVGNELSERLRVMYIHFVRTVADPAQRPGASLDVPTRDLRHLFTVLGRNGTNVHSFERHSRWDSSINLRKRRSCVSLLETTYLNWPNIFCFYKNVKTARAIHNSLHDQILVLYIVLCFVSSTGIKRLTIVTSLKIAF